MAMKQQRGGTIVGIIIGILLGLCAALAVAIYVTKVPVPFVNKPPVRSAEQDQEEARKNKGWDPNAPLQSKVPARTASATLPAASGVAAPARSGADPVTRPPATHPVDSKADPKAAAKPAPSSDPLGDLARAKTAGAAPAAAQGSTPAGADPFMYFVQAGAFRTPEDAEAQRAKLGLLGLDAKVTEREQSGRTVFRVRLGPFKAKDEADKAKERLDGGGFESALVRVQR